MSRDIIINDITYASISTSEIVIRFSRCSRFNLKEMDCLIRQLNKVFRNLGNNDLHLFRRNFDIRLNVRGRVFNLQRMKDYFYEDWHILNIDGDFQC